MISKAINCLNVEFEFFERNRMHEINGHRLAAYGARVLNGPRPESYREDYSMAQKHFTNDFRRHHFTVILMEVRKAVWISVVDGL